MEDHAFLNRQLANFKVLHEKLYHFHWYVKGENFHQLHREFQTDYEQVAEFIDEIAERIIMKNGKPVSKLKDSVEFATLQEDQEEGMNYFEMVFSLEGDYKKIIREFEEGIKNLDFDPVTEDLLIHMLAFFEKRYWMHNAFLSSAT